MRVTILGAGTAIPATHHSPAGVHICAGGEHLLFDAGPGTSQRLHTIGVTLLDLDRMFLTHYHLDHCLDLASILFALRIPDPARKKPLTIYGPKGLTKLYRQLNVAFHGWLAPRTYRLTFKALGETTLRMSRYTIRTKSMNHSTLALGYRLEAEGRVVAYSGDTDVCREIIELGRRADLFILECSMPDERKTPGHLTPSECGHIAAQARCRHLVLTHFYPMFAGHEIHRRVRRQFAGRVTLAKDFLSLNV